MVPSERQSRPGGGPAGGRPGRFAHHRWLGDKRTMVVHDLDRVTPGCRLDDLLASERFASFGPDSLTEARDRCFRPCRHCVAGGD